MLRSLSSVIAFLFAVSTIHDNARGNRGSLVKVVGGGGSGGAFAGNGQVEFPETHRLRYDWESVYS